MGVCKSADPCYFLARSVDPTFFSFKSGSTLLKNFPWFKYTAYQYIYLFSFSSTVFRFARSFLFLLVF